MNPILIVHRNTTKNLEPRSLIKSVITIFHPLETINVILFYKTFFNFPVLLKEYFDVKP